MIGALFWLYKDWYLKNELSVRIQNSWLRPHRWGGPLVLQPIRAAVRYRLLGNTDVVDSKPAAKFNGSGRLNRDICIRLHLAMHSEVSNQWPNCRA